jgi:choline monooxygenase
MPEFDGVADFPSPADDLPTVPFGTWGKHLFASVFPTASLEDVLGPMQARLAWLPLDEFQFAPDLARDYLVEANWALYVDNYLEGLHIPFIHADLNAAIDFENYTTELFEWGNLQLAVASTGELAFDLPPTSPDYGQRIGAYYYWIFPNLMFNFYPWGLSINVVRPLGPERTKVSFLPYVWDASKRGAGAGSALDRVEREENAAGKELVFVRAAGVREDRGESRHERSGRATERKTTNAAAADGDAEFYWPQLQRSGCHV